MTIMLDEILDQPAALARSYSAERKHAVEFKRLAARQKFKLILLVARGTSDNAAQFGRYLLELTSGIPVSLCAPSIHTLYRAKLDLRQSLVIGISQSGEGTDINFVLKAARRQGALTVGITNEAKSTMARIASEVFLVRAGAQRSVAATKTYTGQLLMLYLLASALSSGVRLEEIESIPATVEQALKLAPEIRQVVERYRYMRECVVVGRGLNYSNAFEFALKLMETCYIVAERFSGADFLHGPIAMVERGFPVFLLMPPGPTYPGLKRLAQRVRRLRAETVIISSAGVALPPATRTITIPVPVPELYSTIPYIVPGQLFAASLAEIKGIDPDKPRSLKIVTQTL